MITYLCRAMNVIVIDDVSSKLNNESINLVDTYLDVHN